MSEKKSSVCTYFSKLDNYSAKYNKCNNIIKCKGGSTAALENHLKNKHSINLKRSADMFDEENKIIEVKRAKILHIIMYYVAQL